MYNSKTQSLVDILYSDEGPVSVLDKNDDIEDLDNLELDYDETNTDDIEFDTDIFEELDPKYELRHNYELDPKLFELPFADMDSEEMEIYKLRKDALNYFRECPMVKFPNCSFVYIGTNYYKITYPTVNPCLEISKVDDNDVPEFVRDLVENMNLLACSKNQD